MNKIKPKEFIEILMKKIQNGFPDLCLEAQWNVLLDISMDISRKNSDPELMIAFFRKGLRESENMEKKHKGWTKIMKDGLKKSVQMLQIKDQNEALFLKETKREKS